MFILKMPGIFTKAKGLLRGIEMKKVYVLVFCDGAHKEEKEEFNPFRVDDILGVFTSIDSLKLSMTEHDIFHHYAVWECILDQEGCKWCKSKGVQKHLKKILGE